MVWITTELCRNPLDREKPVEGPAGPRKVSEKNQAICDELSDMAETPSPPAQSAQPARSEYTAHSSSSAAGSGPPPDPVEAREPMAAGTWTAGPP